MRMGPEKKSRLPDGDDGRTIANMNVDGMPWYSPREDAGTEPDADGQKTRKDPKENGFPLTKRETRYYTWGALKAALLVTGVLCAGIVLFVLFCVYVWFR